MPIRVARVRSLRRVRRRWWPRVVSSRASSRYRSASFPFRSLELSLAGFLRLRPAARAAACLWRASCLLFGAGPDLLHRPVRRLVRRPISASTRRRSARSISPARSSAATRSSSSVTASTRSASSISARRSSSASAIACLVTAFGDGPVTLFLAFYLLRLTGQSLMIHVEATATARAFDARARPGPRHHRARHPARPRWSSRRWRSPASRRSAGVRPMRIYRRRRASRPPAAHPVAAQRHPAVAAAGSATATGRVLGAGCCAGWWFSCARASSGPRCRRWPSCPSSPPPSCSTSRPSPRSAVGRSAWSRRAFRRRRSPTSPASSSPAASSTASRRARCSCSSRCRCLAACRAAGACSPAPGRCRWPLPHRPQRRPVEDDHHRGVGGAVRHRDARHHPQRHHHVHGVRSRRWRRSSSAPCSMPAGRFRPSSAPSPRSARCWSCRRSSRSGADSHEGAGAPQTLNLNSITSPSLTT